MPRFEPFSGIRYDPERVALDDVTAPPYVVHIDLPRDEPSRDRYTAAGCRLDEWLAAEVLANDDEPGFYAYRMGFHDDEGRARQTAGVIGALELAVPGEGDVLPHEHTMSKPKDDRLNLMRSCRANLSPIWGLSLSEGLAQLCEPPGPPVARCTDEQGVQHRLWRITEPGALAAIAESVSASPVVIADGHHRYETALHYRDERRAAGEGPGPDDLLMALVVELTEEQLTVRPIHRLVSGLPEGYDIAETLSTDFDVFDGGPPGESLTTRMADAGAMALVAGGRAWLLRPRDGDLDTDADRLDAALDALPPHEITYQHGVEATLAFVEKGEAQAAVLLRAVTVDQIAAAARARRRMPAKSTFFWPKVRTGMVFRRLE